MESRPLDEQTLVARAQRGDNAAYEELVRMHQTTAFRVAYVVCRDTSDAEDAVQEGFLKAYRALWRFRRGAPFRPWLLRIVANEARNRQRSGRRRSRLELRLAAESAVSGDAAPSPETALLGGERRDRLLAALGTLSDSDREVLVLRHLLDLSERETARALGIRAGTVKSRTSRALDRLRAEIAEEDRA